MRSKPFTVMVLILILLLVAGCQSQKPEAAAPTEPAAQSDTAVPLH